MLFLSARNGIDDYTQVLIPEDNIAYLLEEYRECEDDDICITYSVYTKQGEKFYTNAQRNGRYGKLKLDWMEL